MCNAKGASREDVRLHQLVESLKGALREDVYYGCTVSCDTMEPSDDNYMAGIAYALSSDMVEWIARSEITRNNTVGREDRVVATWMKGEGRGRNKVNTNPAMHNFLQTSNKEWMLYKCRHDFTSEDVDVRRLKNNARWASMLKCFNVTKGLKPSKFYHFPRNFIDVRFL